MERYTIIVSGPWQSGTSTFLQSISDSKVIDLPTPLHYYNMLSIPVDDDLELQVIATPARQRMEFIWDYLPSVIGIILVVDSAEPQKFREAHTIFETFLAYYPVPLIVAANMQDLPEAWSPEDLRIALRIPDWLPVVPCVATDHESVRKVLLTLLEHVCTSLEEPVLE